jgi:excisionase family DNA binding protein
MIAVENRYLSVRELADRLRVAPGTVYRLVRNGQLPFVRLGGPGSSLRFSARELERWLSNTSARNPDA